MVPAAAIATLRAFRGPRGWGVGLGSPLWGVVAGAAGLLAGALVVRTRSLLVPVAWHVALNVSLYALLACRA